MSQQEGPQEQHLPHEAWHVVQQRRSTPAPNVQNEAQFFAYISPKNNTEENLTDWKVVISQGNWSGEITSENPDEILHSPGLSGEFRVEVWAGGPNMKYQQLKNDSSQSGPNVMCSLHCTSMILLFSTNPEGTAAKYYTTSDAFCED